MVGEKIVVFLEGKGRYFVECSILCCFFWACEDSRPRGFETTPRMERNVLGKSTGAFVPDPKETSTTASFRAVTVVSMPDC